MLLRRKEHWRVHQELAWKEDEVHKQGEEIHEKDDLLAKYKGMLGMDIE